MGNRKSELMGTVDRRRWNVLGIDSGDIIEAQTGRFILLEFHALRTELARHFVCTRTYVFVCTWRSEASTGVFLHYFLPYFLRRGLSPTLEPTV